MDMVLLPVPLLTLEQMDLCLLIRFVLLTLPDTFALSRSAYHAASL
jgi:hypothetical protein